MNRGLFVVMGVSGAGKTVIGWAFARALGVAFIEGDDFHPRANVEKMSAGVPLTDDDRAGWLAILGRKLHEAHAAHAGVVLACSALKRMYRDTLREGAGTFVRFIYLRGSRDLIAGRLSHRSGHFMPPSLLESQLATLEEPAPDEDAWVADVNAAPDTIVADLVTRASQDRP